MATYTVGAKLLANGSIRAEIVENNEAYWDMTINIEVD